jgi:hypothetical protein
VHLCSFNPASRNKAGVPPFESGSGDARCRQLFFSSFFLCVPPYFPPLLSSRSPRDIWQVQVSQIKLYNFNQCSTQQFFSHKLKASLEVCNHLIAYGMHLPTLPDVDNIIEPEAPFDSGSGDLKVASFDLFLELETSYNAGIPRLIRGRVLMV